MKREIQQFIADNNNNIDHQQDVLHSQDGIMSCLCPGTHAMGSHLTKTVIETERYENMEDNKYVVRRLTPGECARLQGFPDGWCDKVPHSDSVQYKMWGNGMCLPVILYCEQGMVDVIKQRREAEKKEQ